MNTHSKIALLLLVIGALALGAAKLVLSFLEGEQSIALSDSRAIKGKITIGVDNWVGYFPLCSKIMKQRLFQQGYALECSDDRADYRKRMEALAKGKLDLAVATVDAFIVNGAPLNYPGVVVAVLDESKGGDAMLAWQDKIASLDELRRNTEFKIAFTPDSPSDQLLKSIAVHFDLPRLKQRQGWPVYANGSEDALRRLLAKEADAAVLWQPDVSRALQEKGIAVLLSTEQTRQLIVDVLIAGKEALRRRPDMVQLLLGEYFYTLKYYRENESELLAELKKTTGLDDTAVKTLLTGIDWQGLSENAQYWFGVGASGALPEQRLVETVHSTIGILADYGTIAASPLPDNDPYRITNSQFIAALQQQLAPDPMPLQQAPETFPPLTEVQWQHLQPVGKLKIRPILFASGSDFLSLDDKKQLDEAAETLRHYPDFRIMVRGHTSLKGDKQSNISLSQDRADAVARYLNITHAIPETRMRALGVGGEEPLPPLPGESRRAYNYRLPRVELILLADKL
ncbi:MAG: phosphate ABC transporter substrate-binding/OmpA family protein [Gammaproteobacteria bacterium]